MDCLLVQTFLCICRMHSFSAAAQELCITQTAVTARIKQLEQHIGFLLFIRNKNGAKLTEQGQQFKPFAMQIVEAWDSAKHEISFKGSLQNSLVIGCELSLWNPIAAQWLIELEKKFPQLRIVLEVNDSALLYEKLLSNHLDIVLSHTENYRQSIGLFHLLDETLIHVKSAQQPSPYIFVDWGEKFKQMHHEALPEFAHSNMAVTLGPVALQIILNRGGSGYFRTRVVNQYLKSGELKLCKQSPQFSYPVYFAYNKHISIDVDEIKHSLLTAFEQNDDWF
ncbi:LysR family transcriptional regulator [Thalassotalea sp. 1_MG-2023]|uniref:LysR family transcriptional regulator n=1 Tax=Thalassotalea sp. 1_MG-2023 TaxID=3062680 RepID=UPI002702E23B|nr:LysR family transcriptional regulator [Thalassotalea sp. 1_MG-2023]